MAEFDSGVDPNWEAPLSHVFRVLGLERDQYVRDRETRGQLQALGAPPLPDWPTTARPPDVASPVSSPEFQWALLAALAFAANATPAAGPAFDGDPVAALCDRLDQLQDQIRRGGRRFTELPIQKQHRLRKRLKSLRYLAEFISPLYGGRRVAKYFEPLQIAQDALGRLNDEALALAHYRRCTQENPEAPGAWFAVGWLIARQETLAASAGGALLLAGKARRFWR